MAGLSTFHSGPKRTKMVNQSVFLNLGPFWAHLDPFGPFQTKIDFLLRSISAKPYFVHGGPQSKKMVHRQVSYVWPDCGTPKHPVWNIRMTAIYEK